ncbi:MAG: flagellar protein FliS [Candidatus Kapabacteria bacterium]|nr:flagellar protein FliS [Candidatus Kapabacteria bacterium]MCS7170179.1 flagellar protein FliS [Candidatus Kapabacteria bacterium]MDW7997584.1 flagellar export chaperone FliS [Bacteroidota bacterium]MDW8225987.1 flagellar export chaperone FliS [Bacteroidota bacterium]
MELVSKAISPYLEQEIVSWSPEKLILRTYDVFLTAYRRRDIQRMNQALAHLIDALNFEAGEVAFRLYRLYEYCRRCLWERRYDEAATIIEELRAAWAEAFGED